MYQQRRQSAPAARRVAGVWRPEPEGTAVVFAPESGDRYGVVDDLEAGQVILVLDRWPTVDAAGHLVFPGRAMTRNLPVGQFQGLVDAQRAASGQPAPDRALRVGDVFWIRVGEDSRLEGPEQWRILDVTGPARRAARAAQLVAANPALRQPEPAPATRAAGPDGQPDGDAPESRPATGVASPAV